MVYAVMHNQFWEIEGADTFKTGSVYPVFVGVGAALVVRVDPAGFTKEVPGRLGVELIEGEVFLARDDPKPTQRGGHSHRPAHPAERTGTPAGR